MQLLWRTAIGRMFLAIAIAVGLSCELVVSPGTLQNGECGAASKACADPQGDGGACVGLDDPNFQCASSSCAPCSLPHAVPICGTSGTCAIGSCTTDSNLQGEPVEEWTDCNAIASDGCESDLLHGSPAAGGAIENCGSCGNTCAAPHALLNGCTAGSCVVNECDPGFLNCDRNVHNGCEVESDSGGCDGG